MRAYCGQTREMDLVRKLAAVGVGECTVRGELKSRKRDPWFYDNGAYRDWSAGNQFNARQWMGDMRRIRYSTGSDHTPDFVVIPDLVAAGLESLKFSAFYRDDADDLPAYLAVQDGMTGSDVCAFLEDAEHNYAGLFVGGTLEWKLETASSWVELAHAIGRKCHIGRVGTPERVTWAHKIGADSIDSCLPIMFDVHLEPFLTALAECGGSN